MSRLSWLIFGITAIYAFWLFPQLPEQIPIHFGPDGTPDGWGSRGTIFLPVGMSLFLQLFLTIVPKLGASMSTNARGANDTAAELGWSLRFIEAVRLWIAGLFLVILWSTASVVQGQAEGLTWPFFAYTGIGLVAILTVAIRRGLRK